MPQTPPKAGGLWKPILRVLGIAGWSGAGKTTLIEKLIPALAARGWRVSTLKRTHHSVDLDQPGKDSFRHREAGAVEVMLASSSRFTLMSETPQPLGLRALVARMAPVDLVLVEGFKLDAMPKIEVYRAALGKPRLWPDTPDIVAMAADTQVAELPCFDINAADELANAIVRENWGSSVSSDRL